MHCECRAQRVKTPMQGPATYDFLAKIYPVGHASEVQDFVDAALWLESASLVTGEILRVDGGEAARLG
jgi:NAD(P)-dependent dehydrogenase (short-subunit alcohol dehydrogenase family)